MTLHMAQLTPLLFVVPAPAVIACAVRRIRRSCVVPVLGTQTYQCRCEENADLSRSCCNPNFERRSSDNDFHEMVFSRCSCQDKEARSLLARDLC